MSQYKPKDIVLLENIRFYPQEKKNKQNFAKRLSLLADIFVNDAFGVCHRAHASVIGITEFLPSVAGLLLEKEIRVISQAVDCPKKPLVVIIGGAKLEDKIRMIGRLIDKADYCLIGGKAGSAFLKVKKGRIDNFSISKETRSLIKKLFWRALASRTALVLPADVIKDNNRVLDIGFQTRKKFSQIIKRAKTIIRVGPMGFYYFNSICNQRES